MTQYLVTQLRARLPRFLVDVGVTLLVALLATLALRILLASQPPSIISFLNLPILTFRGDTISLYTLLHLLVILWFAASLLANLVTQAGDIISGRPRGTE